MDLETQEHLVTALEQTAAHTQEICAELKAANARTKALQLEQLIMLAGIAAPFRAQMTPRQSEQAHQLADRLIRRIETWAGQPEGDDFR